MSGSAARSLPLQQNSPEVEAAFESAPPGCVVEIIDGELHTMPRPRATHSRAASRLGRYIGRLHAAVRVTQPLHVYEAPAPGPIDDAVGAHVAALVDDGATLQMGIGAIPDAALRRLHDKRDLGIHTEMFSDGVVDLVERGVITGAAKDRDRGKIVAAFMLGSERLYRFAHDNPNRATIDTRSVVSIVASGRDRSVSPPAGQ